MSIDVTKKAAEAVQPRRDEPRRQLVPNMHVRETGDGYELLAELPGVEEGQVHLTVEDRTLTLEAEPAETEHAGYRLVRQERPLARYRGVLEVPERVDTRAIQAKMNNGMLRLVLPTREEVKPRKIAVHAA